MDPKVVCLTLTCGGVKTIGETVHSFNQQTYQNRQLVILDTHPQPIQFSEPLPANVDYVRVPSHRFKSLGDKTQFALGLAQGICRADFVTQFEHDDIFLPHHLSSVVRTAQAHAKYNDRPLMVGHRDHFSSVGGVDGEPMTIRRDRNMCWCRFLFQHVDGHWQKATQDPFDLHYLQLPWQYVWQDDAELPGYIYRWGNGQHHMSGWYGQKPHDELYRMAEDIFSAEDISGRVAEIGWRHDYPALCKEVWETRQAILHA